MPRQYVLMVRGARGRGGRREGSPLLLSLSRLILTVRQARDRFGNARCLQDGSTGDLITPYPVMQVRALTALGHVTHEATMTQAGACVACDNFQ